MTTTPTNKYAISYAGTTIYADTAAEALAVSNGIAEVNGNILPTTKNSKTKYEITLGEDGALRCPDYRLQATQGMRKAGHWPCRFCGRRVTPWGGRVSVTPFVQSHFSGPMAYQERSLEIPRNAYDQLIRAGCPVKLDNVAPLGAPKANAEPVISPAGSPLWDQVMERLGQIEARKNYEDRLAAIEARLDIIESLPVVELPAGFDEAWQTLRAVVEDWRAKEETLAMVRRTEQNPPPPLKGGDKIQTGTGKKREVLILGYQNVPRVPAADTKIINSIKQLPDASIYGLPLAPTKDIKSSVDRLDRIRNYSKQVAKAKPAATTSKPVATPTTPVEKKRSFVRDQRVMETPDQPPSERASKFRQSRNDLGIPANVMADTAGFTLAEYQALESGELSPRAGSEKSFWADMRAALERAHREWNHKELPELPRGEPAKKYTSRGDTKMF